MGAQLPPPVYAQHIAQHPSLPPGGQSFGLVGAQYPAGLSPGTVPVQQLTLPHYASPTVQHASYSHPLHQQFPTPACIPAHTTQHGYAGHYAAPPGDAMVDLEEHLGSIQPTYVVSAPAAPPPVATNPDPINNRVDVLEKALHLVQGADLQPHQFRDLCYFQEALLPPKYKIPDFENIMVEAVP